MSRPVKSTKKKMKMLTLKKTNGRSPLGLGV